MFQNLFFEKMVVCFCDEVFDIYISPVFSVSSKLFSLCNCLSYTFWKKMALQWLQHASLSLKSRVNVFRDF